MGGTLLALGLSRRALLGADATDGSVRRAAVAVGRSFEQADALLRRRPDLDAGICMYANSSAITGSRNAWPMRSQQATGCHWVAQRTALMSYRSLRPSRSRWRTVSVRSTTDPSIFQVFFDVSSCAGLRAT
jgi:hypothetical protein